MLIKHLRDEFNTPYATLVAIKDGDKVKIGCSICCPKDHFNKQRGIKIAKERAEKDKHVKVPNRWVIGIDRYHPMEELIDVEMWNMIDRAHRYYRV